MANGNNTIGFPTASKIRARIIDFTDRNTSSAEKIADELKKAIPNLRLDTDFRSTTVNDKVRDAEILRIPYLITIGDKEEKSSTLAVRERGSKPKFGVKMQDFIKEIKEKIEKRE